MTIPTGSIWSRTVAVGAGALGLVRGPGFWLALQLVLVVLLAAQIASRGGWGRDGTWYAVAYVDTRAAELLFRQKVIAFLAGEGLLDARSDRSPGLLEVRSHWVFGPQRSDLAGK